MSTSSNNSSITTASDNTADHYPQQRIAVHDLFRHAGSAVCSAATCMQGSDRVVTLRTRPWDAHALHWRVLPVHTGESQLLEVYQLSFQTVFTLSITVYA
jgi:hypothetical protein